MNPSLVPIRLLAGLVLSLGLAPSARAAAPADSVEAGYVEVEGGRVYYEAAGQGTVLLMVHDGLLHRETWNAPFAAFAGQYRVVRWDRRGYGRSEAAEAPYSLVDDLLAVVNATGAERVILMGCSAGGMLSIHFALAHPERVAALVLVGPIVSGLGFSEHFTTRGGRGLPPEDAPVAQKIAYWTGQDPWLLAPENSAARQRARALLEANPKNVQSPGRFGRWGDGEGPALGRLSQIQVPTLLVTGEGDIPDVHTHMGALQAGIAGSKRVVLPGSGHLPQLEVPDAFNAVVRAFLEDVD